jgi:hypothetical protein
MLNLGPFATLITGVRVEAVKDDCTASFNAAHPASGVYFYRIQAGDFATIRSIMLLK